MRRASMLPVPTMIVMTNGDCIMAFVGSVLKNSLKVFPFVALLAFSNSAFASSSVTIGGATTTCDNQCVVTFSGGGNYSISDCCGGRIHTTYNTPGTKPNG